MVVWKMVLLLKGCILRFHVNLPGCKHVLHLQQTSASPSDSPAVDRSLSPQTWGIRLQTWCDDLKDHGWFRKAVCFIYNHLKTSTRWFKVTFLSPSWRSLNLWKGHSLNHPKKVTKNCQVYSIKFPPWKNVITRSHEPVFSTKMENLCNRKKKLIPPCTCGRQQHMFGVFAKQPAVQKNVVQNEKQEGEMISINPTSECNL